MRASTFSRRSSSSPAWASASLTIFSISLSLKPLDASIRIFCSLPVPRSLADTLRIPLASRSNSTSICGAPRDAGGIPSRWKRPMDLLSSAVEKISAFSVGIVVLRVINGVITPPSVSIPSDRGMTSRSNTSVTSPAKTPAWMDAPTPTTSSGFTPLCGSFPKNSSTTS